jgi:hypothetical protein
VLTAETEAVALAEMLDHLLDHQLVSLWQEQQILAAVAVAVEMLQMQE